MGYFKVILRNFAFSLQSADSGKDQQVLRQGPGFLIKRTLKSAVNGLCKKGYLILEQVPRTKNGKNKWLETYEILHRLYINHLLDFT